MNKDERQAIHALMVRLADGERAVFRELADALWPPLLAFTGRSLGTREDAEDVAQQVFLRIASRLSEFDRTRDGVAWAFGIATHEVLTQRARLRRRREHGTPDAGHDAAAPEPSAEEALDQARVEAAFSAIVGQLSEDDRRALGLLPATEALSPAAARKRKQRALDRLKALWRTIHGDA